MRKINFYDDKNIIGKRLRKERKRRRLTQEDLAAKMQIMNVNIDQQAISRIERNLRMVTDYELRCFCEILEIDPNEMLKDYFIDDL